MDWLAQNWVWILLVVAVLFLMRRGGMAGCGIGPAHGGAASGGARREPDAQTAQPTDPVSGKAVDMARASTSFHAGRVYYFESPQTRQRFEAAPERYAAGDVAAGSSAASPHQHRGC